MRGGRLKNNMKTMPTDLAKYTILKSEKDGVRLSSHFSTSCFTIAVFDNFDNADNSFSGVTHAHDIVITIFQEEPHNSIC